MGAVLGDAGVTWWLFGGWAADFHAGRITRDHDDIELFVWRADADRASMALARAGYQPARPLHPDEGQPFVKDGIEVGAWFLTTQVGGRIVTPGRWTDWPWPDGAFDGPMLYLGDVRAHAMSLQGLLQMKEGFAQHPHGAPPREKDVADLELLKQMLATVDRDRALR